jgi:hypothetical protein
MPFVLEEMLRLESPVLTTRRRRGTWRSCVLIRVEMPPGGRKARMKCGATAQEHFQNFYREAVTMPAIVGLKVYDAGMRVISSQAASRAGQPSLGNLEFKAVVAGHRIITSESAAEPGGRSLLHVHMPIVFEGDSRVLGVVDVYKEPGQLFVGSSPESVTVTGARHSSGRCSRCTSRVSGSRTPDG